MHGSHQGHTRQHNDAKETSLGSLLGVQVKLSNGIAEQNNNQTYIHRVTYWYPNWLFWCPAWGTEPNSTQKVWLCWYSTVNSIWNDLNIMRST